MRFVSILILSGFTGPALGTTIIDFEDWTEGSAARTSASSGGFTFTNPNLFGIVKDHPGASQNGTLNLWNVGGGTLTMTRNGGGEFDLLQADLGEGTLESPSSVVHVTGYFSTGGSISAVVPLDGVLPTFQTTSFSGFSGLSSVAFTATWGISTFSLDDIVVPEASAAYLFVAGLFLMFRRMPRCPSGGAFWLAMGAAALGTSASRGHAAWNGGPVLIGGDDMDDHFTSPWGGAYYIRECFTFIGTHVTNGKTLAVCLGCKTGQATTSFNTAFDASALPGLTPAWSRVCVSGADGIADFFNNSGPVRIADAGLIYLPSSGPSQPPGQVVGGISQDELDVVNAYKSDLASFVAAGGGLFTHTLQGLDHAWDWLAVLLPQVMTIDKGAPLSQLSLTCAAEHVFFPNLTPAERQAISPRISDCLSIRA